MQLKFNRASIRVLVRKNYGECFDFYTKKMGLIPNWGDRNGPYTDFVMAEGGEVCLAIFAGENMPQYKGYTSPTVATQPDTVEICLPSSNVDEDYKRLKAAGVEFIGEPQDMTNWGMRCVYFRDPEGNLFELAQEL